ncbi:MAG: hypothetical protein HC941_32120 [Microcoleus sp. SU_5_3]|nr:hypothetical protein [Microcoleus sp. SU_5_3]
MFDKPRKSDKKADRPFTKKQSSIDLFTQISTYAPQQKKPGFSLNLPFPCSISQKPGF